MRLAQGRSTMKRTLKTFLCLSAFDVIVSSAAGVGFMRSQETLAAEQVWQQPPRQRLADRRAQPARVIGEDPGAERRTAAYEACASEVQSDYSDDPERAYAWVRTLCHR